MNCREVRKVITTTPLAKTTRAQRAAIERHLDRCDRCEAWFWSPRTLAKLPPDDRIAPGQYAEVKAETDRMRDEDERDPEYRSVVDA